MHEAIVESVAYERGLNHTVNITPEDHGKFKESFRIFKEKTNFEGEEGVMMLKYFVQMAFLEGWRARESGGA